MRPAPAVARWLPWTVVLGLLLAGAPRSRAEGDAGPVAGPHLAFASGEHDFGKVGQEEELKATFPLRNDGTETVRGIRAIGDCGCYGVTLSAEELAPGESATLDVTFRTLMFSGRITKRLKVLTANGPREPVTLLLKLEVVAGVILEPGRLWFGDVLVGTTPSQTVHVKWHEEAGRPFHVTSVEVPGTDAFAVTTAPYEQGPWKGTALTLAFTKAPPLGMFSATALVRTDHPDYPRISLPVTANVTGRVWVQSRTVYFGWVEQGKAKTTSLLVKPFSDEVDLGEVTASSRGGHVKVEVEKQPMGRKGWWRVVIEVPPDAPVGKLDDVLEIHSAVPGEEVTAIEVRGEVLALGD